jgi:hypothetical protein
LLPKRFRPELALFRTRAHLGILVSRSRVTRSIRNSTTASSIGSLIHMHTLARFGQPSVPAFPDLMTGCCAPYLSTLVLRHSRRNGSRNAVGWARISDSLSLYLVGYDQPAKPHHRPASPDCPATAPSESGPSRRGRNRDRTNSAM